jgi:hypothetical protein
LSSSLPCWASANKISKKLAMSRAGRKNWIGVNVDGLAFGTRRVNGLDAEQFGAKLDERHPLAGTRVRDLLAFVRHQTRKRNP